MAKHKVEKFPLRVKQGSTVVKIYQERKRSGTYYRVVYYLGGKRHRLSVGDLDAAKAEAAAKATQLARGDVDAVQLTGRDRLTYGRALDAVKPFGTPLDAAAIEYAEAKKLLGGHSLIEAAGFYVRHHGHGIAAKSVAEAVIEFANPRRMLDDRNPTLKTLRIVCAHLPRRFIATSAKWHPKIYPTFWER